jgi:L,D-transpeptidase YcbB
MRFPRSGLIVTGIVTILLFNPFALFTQEQSPEELIREYLRQRIEAAGYPPQLMVNESQIYSTVLLPQFYLNRIYRPAWSDNTGPLSIADSLLDAVRNAYLDGLHPEDYHLIQIEELLTAIRERQRRNQPVNYFYFVDLDLLLTDAFLTLGSHLFGGRLDPVSFDPEWQPSRREVDLVEILNNAVQNRIIKESLYSLLPHYSEYFRLRESLARYRKVHNEGGWPVIPEGPTMRRGESGERITALQERLLLAGDLDRDVLTNDRLFDHTLESAVIRFQRRHGLEPDGLVGRETLAQLNTSVEKRLQQVLINMERWRWLPTDLGDRYIIVNIANFELEVIESGELVMNMRVIVGRHYRRTPVFTGHMTYLVLSPFWNIPPGITANDVLPQVRSDIYYLEKNNIRVFRGWGSDAEEIDPVTVDWSAITPRNNPYRFRQDPGPDNSLGLVKFMFPNRFNVYLHDTPARELFSRVQRDFSSGCIRIEKPVELAEYLLANRSQWTRESIIAAMRQPVERTVTLSRPIPVHILYWTAWAEEDGTIHFRRDIYNRDQRLYDVLYIPLPTHLSADYLE